MRRYWRKKKKSCSETHIIQSATVKRKNPATSNVRNTVHNRLLRHLSDYSLSFRCQSQEHTDGEGRPFWKIKGLGKRGGREGGGRRSVLRVFDYGKHLLIIFRQDLQPAEHGCCSPSPFFLYTAHFTLGFMCIQEAHPRDFILVVTPHWPNWTSLVEIKGVI